MEGQIRVDFNNTHPIVEQSRPLWKHKEYFIKQEYPEDVTVLICQRNTKQATQLAIESLQRFYPDIKIIVVDDESTDDSVQYLQYKELTSPNLKVWWQQAGRGHGGNMHEAIMKFVTTRYVMLMDSDVIIERGTFIEQMLKRFTENIKLYAIGTLQYSSYSNNGGEPFTPEDAVPYANPQLSIYCVATYKELVEVGTDSRGEHVIAPFLHDGTPCILNMKAAFDSNCDVEYFPTDKYSTHNSGSSWAFPKTVWMHDHDVKLRPFLTIIIGDNTKIDLQETDTDFDIVVVANKTPDSYTFTDLPAPQPFDTDGKLFPIRFNTYGEYVLDCSKCSTLYLVRTFVIDLKKKVIEEKVPDEIEVNGIKCFKREYWQKTVR